MNFNDMGFLEHVIGMPYWHKDAFIKVAREQQVVIIVRATGPTCHGLLDEGYDTKGYRIHGKSCDWGPMAGFVLRDPRLNKYGEARASFNRDKHSEAIDLDHEGQGWKASVTPLVISSERIAWLRKAGRIALVHTSDKRFDGTARHGDTPLCFNFTLLRSDHNPALWYVFFNYEQVGRNPAARAFRQEVGSSARIFHPTLGAEYEAMLALTNPIEHRRSQRPHYLNAITGDYDLFAVWAFSGNYRRHPYTNEPNRNPYDASAFGDDHRPLGTVRGLAGAPGDRGFASQGKNIDDLERNFAATARGMQGTKLGNITPRIYRVCQLVNSLVGNQVLWHSDEAARPYLDDADLPVIAFTPRGNYIGITDDTDFRALINYCDREGIHVTLSSAWTLEWSQAKPNRVGAAYARFVPPDGRRVIVPEWYNR
nr:anthrax toxin-like adenylyl cyclase domain-containing protein [uncultured Duganella sp.]